MILFDGAFVNHVVDIVAEIVINDIVTPLDVICLVIYEKAKRKQDDIKMVDAEPLCEFWKVDIKIRRLAAWQHSKWIIYNQIAADY